MLIGKKVNDDSFSSASSRREKNKEGKLTGARAPAGNCSPTLMTFGDLMFRFIHGKNAHHENIFDQSDFYCFLCSRNWS